MFKRMLFLGVLIAGMSGGVSSVAVALSGLPQNLKKQAVQHTLKVQKTRLTDLYGADAVQTAARIYTNAQHNLLWQDRLFKQPTKQMLKALDNASAFGLSAALYHVQPLAQFVDNTRHINTLERLARQDVWLTTAWLRFSHDVMYGRERPAFYSVHKEEDSWRAVQEMFFVTLAKRNFMDIQNVEKFKNPAFKILQQQYVHYKTLAEADAWETLPRLRQKYLTLGEKETKLVPALIQRLQAEGWLSSDFVETTLYTEDIMAAVKSFQARVGIKPSGIIGQKTLRALNISPQARAEQLQLALERWRWLPNTLGKRHIMVHLAGYELTAYDTAVAKLSMPVIIGKRTNQTPMMHTLATDVTFNPYWYIPDSILQKKLLPKLRANPDIFYRRNYEAAYGNYRAPAEADIQNAIFNESRYGELRIRQRPGRYNALGRARIGIKNYEAIYLHDTPYKGLFKRSSRALSHGCVRLERPQELVTFLLEDADWDNTQTDVLFNLKQPQKPTIVDLKTRVPVYLSYATAWVDGLGHLRFSDDIYGQDAPLLAALQRPEIQVAAR